MRRQSRRILRASPGAKGIRLPAMCNQHTWVALGTFRSASRAISAGFVVHEG